MGLMQPLRAVDSRSPAPRGNAYRLSLGADASVTTQSAGTGMNMHRGQVTTPEHNNRFANSVVDSAVLSIIRFFQYPDAHAGIITGRRHIAPIR